MRPLRGQILHHVGTFKAVSKPAIVAPRAQGGDHRQPAVPFSTGVTLGYAHQLSAQAPMLRSAFGLGPHLERGAVDVQSS